MSTGPYATVGPHLVEGGYSAIPIMPGTKRPGSLKRGEWVGMTNWREAYSRSLPTRFEMQIWSQTDAGVCIVTGPGSQHTVGIDIDTDDTIIRAAIFGAIPHTNVIKRGKRGETLFFRGSEIRKSKSWELPGDVHVADLLGPGRQTVLPPTIHPDTKQPYVWIGPDALENIYPAELPELMSRHIAAIDAALRPFGYTEPEQMPKRDPLLVACTDKRLRAYALGVLRGCTEEMEQRKAHRNNLLNILTGKLGRYVIRGALSEDECAVAMWNACITNGLIPDHGARKFWATFWSGLAYGLKRPAPDPSERLAADPATTKQFEQLTAHVRRKFESKKQ